MHGGAKRRRRKFEKSAATYTWRREAPPAKFLFRNSISCRPWAGGINQLSSGLGFCAHNSGTAVTEESEKGGVGVAPTRGGLEGGPSKG